MFASDLSIFSGEKQKAVQLPYLPLVVLCVCAITFYRAGVHEQSWGFLWAALSLAISLVVLFMLHLGLLAVFGGQFLLFVGITVYRVWRKK